MDMIQQDSFAVKKVLKGQVSVKVVDVNIYPRGPGHAVPPYFVDGRKYLVMLRPDRQSLRRLKDPHTLFSLTNRVKRTEVVALLDLSLTPREVTAMQTRAYRSGRWGGFEFTPKKWRAMRRAASVNRREYAALLRFINKKVARTGTTMADVRAWLGVPDRQTRWVNHRHKYTYHLNLPAYRIPRHGAVYGQVEMSFGKEGRLLSSGVVFARWSAKPGHVSSHVLTGSDLEQFLRSFRP